MEVGVAAVAEVVTLMDAPFLLDGFFTNEQCTLNMKKIWDFFNFFFYERKQNREKRKEMEVKGGEEGREMVM